MNDVIFAIRAWRKSPMFALVAVVTLALGVGANTAIFSAVKAVLLNQLPYSHPERIVAVASNDADNPRPITVDFTTTHDWRERSHSFEHLSLYRGFSAALNDQGDPELINGMRVGYDYFDLLGVAVARGRNFEAGEDSPERARILILSHGLWLRRFGGDPAVLGRKVRLNEATYTIVGVLPAGFRPPGEFGQSEMFAPLDYRVGGPSSCRGCQHLRLYGLLKPGVSAAAAQQELRAVMNGIKAEHPKDYSATATVTVTPLRDQIIGRVQTAMWVLLGAVGLVLLIACANVANLLLARATGRARELALRAALGAERKRLVRQLLVENMVLAFTGGLLGLALAVVGTRALVTLGPRDIPRLGEIQIDFTVLAFAFAATLVTGLLFGLAPALRASRVDLNEALKDAGKSTSGRAGGNWRNVLVAAELALAFVLVAGAGLMGKSFLRLMNVDAGYDPHNVLTCGAYVYGQRYQKAEAELALYDQVMDRLRATPGVESVAMVSTLPLASFDRRGFHIQDRPLTNTSDAPSADAYSVSPEYFRVLRIPVKRGRTFTDQDRIGSERVAVISESCARRMWPGEEALGRYIQLGGRDEKKPWLRIVGIVGDIRQYGLDQPSNMEAYIAEAQDNTFAFNMVLRTSGDPRWMERTVREAFASVDKTQPVFNVRPLEDYLRSTLAERSFTLWLLGLFGALALLLAAVGTYGVISYTASLRVREMGIRLALGARRADVLTLVLRQGLLLTAVGLAAGLAASVALSRLLSTLLFEVRPGDIGTSAAVAGLLGLVALGATYLPARRAARVDPMISLRHE
ncbi:MAG TPA: ABC transporter permease [Bryobacteraceae bacterium]|nr:ABC transporter permease [Bryobacteraceae bacterium]